MIVTSESQTAKHLRAIAESIGIQNPYEESKDDFAIIEEAEEGITKDKRLLINQMRGLFNSVPIKIEEKGFLIQLMHNFEMRLAMTDILAEVNQSRQIHSHECLKLIADILRFILTLFVHEQLSDYRLFYSILECSSFLYFT